MAEIVGGGNLFLTHGPPFNGSPASDFALSPGTPTSGNFGVTTYSENGDTWKQLFPSGPNSSADSNPGARTTFSWNMPDVDITATSAAPAGLPADRYMIPQTLTYTGHIAVGTASLNNAILRAFLSVYDPTAGTVTPIATSTDATVVCAVPTNVDFTVTFSIPATRIPTGSTLQLTVFAMSRRGTLANQTLTLRRGPDVGTTTCQLQIPTPGLRYQYLRSHSSTASGLAVIARKVNLSSRLATASALAFLRSFVVYKVLTAIGIATATVTKKVFLNPLLANATATATSTKKVLLSPLLASSTGQAFIRSFLVFKRLNAGSTPVAFAGKLLNKNVTATATAVAIRGAFRISKYIPPATSTGTAKMFVQISQTVLNRLGGGAIIVYKKIFNIFDD